MAMRTNEELLGRKYSGKSQLDVKFLRFLLVQGQFMCLFPSCWESKKQMKYCRVLFALLLCPISYQLVTLRFNFFSVLPISCLVMDIFMFLLSVLYIMSFCIAQIFVYENWLNLRKLVGITENLLTRTKLRVQRISFFWWYILIHIILFTIHVTQMTLWIGKQQYDILVSYMVFRIVHYWVTIVAVLIHQWLNYLSRRYDHLSQYTKEIFSVRVMVIPEIKEKLNLVGEIYKNLTSTCDELNALFSFHILFLIVLSITLALHGISFAIFSKIHIDTSIAAVAFVILFFGNLVALIISHESLKKNCRTAIKVCLVLQEDMFHSELRRELDFLVEYMTNLKPQLTAAGFFEIDLKLLSAFIGSVFSYLIIILQFNMTFI